MTLIILTFFLALSSFIPAIRATHWAFRIFDFLRIQILLLQVIVFVIAIVFYENDNNLLLISMLALFLAMIYQVSVIYPYLSFSSKVKKSSNLNNTISILSVNVLQKNNEYQCLIDLVKEVQPDILLTMETNKDWEDALVEIESEFSFNYKIPKENRYGMHFYTKLKAKSVQEHYFISEERPSIEVHLEEKNGTDFVFIGIHPPPPSPTEKPTSRQKDAELMKVAKIVRALDYPCMVTGDFNNVCWSRSARLFARVSNLKDARLGKGIHGTFPVAPALFTFPLDLLFCSGEIDVTEIKTLSRIGSDHFPFFSRFRITDSGSRTTNKLESELKEKAEEIIESGEKAVEVDE